MRTFTLPEALLHELLVYLSRQPYRDVNRLITELAALPEVGAPPPGAGDGLAQVERQPYQGDAEGT